MSAEVFKPKFSTSAEAQEKNREKREKKGSCFTDRVTTIHGKAAPCEAPQPPTRPVKLQPYPTRLNVADLGPLNEQRK